MGFGNLCIQSFNQVLNGVNLFPLKVNLPTLLTNPSRNLIDKKMVTILTQSVIRRAPNHIALAIETLQSLHLLLRVLKSASHSNKLGA